MVEIDADKLLFEAIRDGLRDGIKSKLTQAYQNPLEKLIVDAVAARGSDLRSLLDDAIRACVTDKEFRDSVQAAVRTLLAKTLVSRFGGELEKQVNALKSDPATRARITLAIEQIAQPTA